MAPDPYRKLMFLKNGKSSLVCRLEIVINNLGITRYCVSIAPTSARIHRSSVEIQELNAPQSDPASATVDAAAPLHRVSGERANVLPRRINISDGGEKSGPHLSAADSRTARKRDHLCTSLEATMNIASLCIVHLLFFVRFLRCSNMSSNAPRFSSPSSFSIDL